MIPKFSDYFYPFLKSLENGEETKIQDIRFFCKQYFHLTEKDLREKTAGGSSKHYDRAKWTASYLCKMGCITRKPDVRGLYKITSNGAELLKEHGENFSLKVLRDIEGFRGSLWKAADSKMHWVPAHLTATGKYIPGYWSNSEPKGLRKKRKITYINPEDNDSDTK